MMFQALLNTEGKEEGDSNSMDEVDPSLFDLDLGSWTHEVITAIFLPGLWWFFRIFLDFLIFFVTNFWNLSVKIKPFNLFSAYLESILANFMHFQDYLLGANHTPVLRQFLQNWLRTFYNWSQQIWSKKPKKSAFSC